MIGVCFEIITTCGHCGAPLPLNALSTSIPCGKCAGLFEITAERWRDMIEDALSQGPYRKVGTGSEQTVFSSFNYELLWARFDPYFYDTKDDIDLAVLPDAAERGFLPHPGAGQAVTVRRLPAEFAEALPSVAYLVAEDPGQLPATSTLEGMDLAGAAEPQAFNCPDCGSALQVDGRHRTIECQYCQASSVLPDAVWFRLHPVTTKKRWFAVIDPGAAPFLWSDDLWDVVGDDEGRTFVAVDIDGDDTLVVAGIGPDRRTLWTRADLPYTSDSVNGDTGLALGPDGRLAVWHPGRHSLTWLDPDTGETVDKLGGKGGRQPAEGKFSLKETQSLAVDRDGSLLAWRFPPGKEWGDDMALLRYDRDGNPAPTWSEATVPPPPEPAPPPKKGFLARLFGGDDQPPEPPPPPPRPDDDYPTDKVVSVGADGSVYLLGYGKLTRVAPNGVVAYRQVEIQSYTSYGRAIGLADGSAQVLGEMDGHNGTFVTRVAPDGTQSVALASIPEGGPVADEEHLTVAADGTVQVLGDAGRWRRIAPDGAVLYCSANVSESLAFIAIAYTASLPLAEYFVHVEGSP